MTTPLTDSTKMLDKHERTGRVVEQTVTLFRAGYRLSFAFVVIGLIVALVRDIPLAAELGPPKELLDHLIDLDPNGFIGLGIGIMILTPILMTVEVAINFFRVDDRRFAGITALVSLILIVTLGLAFI